MGRPPAWNVLLELDLSADIVHVCAVNRAMGGSVDFKTALTTRLSVMKPRRQDIERFL